MTEVDDAVEDFGLALHANKVWAQKMMKMWSLVFPLLVFVNPLSQALRTGDWWPFGILVAIFTPVLWLIWKLRQAMTMLIQVEEIDFETVKLERAEEAERLRLRAARRERAQIRLARIRHARETRSREETVEDLVELAEELGQDES